MDVAFFNQFGVVVLMALVSVTLFQSLVFVCSRAFLRGRNDIADVVWGASFVLIAWAFMFVITTPNMELKLLVLLITLWGFRLTWHIGNRFFTKDKEDSRYTEQRQGWKWPHLRSLFQVFLFQGLLAVLILSPLVAYISLPGMVSTTQLWIGVMVWLVGFVFEVVGDWQLGQFLSRPKNKGQLMTSGLWRYTRHPNYFGEILMWWGIAIMVLHTWFWCYVLTALAGPVLITMLLLFVSGVPLTESMWAEQFPDQYKKYKKTTSRIIPWFPKM